MLEIIRNLGRRKLRSGLTIAGIVIGIFALTTMGSMAERFNMQLDGGVRYYGSNIQVGPPDSQRAALLPLDRAAAIAAVDGVDAVFPRYSFLLKPGSGFSFGGAPESIVNRVPDEVARTDPRPAVARGRDLAEGDRGQVVLGASLAREYGRAVGDTIDLPRRPADAAADFVSRPFTVVGVLAPVGTAPDVTAYVSTSDAQVLLADGLPPAIRGSLDVAGIAPGFAVYGRPGASLGRLDAVARRINAAVPGVKATPPSVPVNGFRQFASLFTAITTGVGILALVIGGLSVVNTMIMAVSERVREIGLKKALGARTRDVLVEYLAEAALIGLIGGVVGYLLGLGLTTAIDAGGATGNLELFLVTPKLTILVIGFAVVLGEVAGLLPALRAARLDPVTALRATR
jgi:putative ABC transport system permease protein